VYDLLERLVRVPADYAWGQALRESFTERLRDAAGSVPSQRRPDDG
jgi:hypothetical protein